MGLPFKTVDTKMLHSLGRCNKSTTPLFSICVSENGTKSCDFYGRVAAFSGILFLAHWSLCQSAYYFIGDHSIGLLECVHLSRTAL